MRSSGRLKPKASLLRPGRFAGRFFFFLLFAQSPAWAQGNHLASLATAIRTSEAQVTGLKKGNAARVEFARPAAPAPTPYAFLYLHGFSASPRESSPLVENLAKEFGANAYFPRYTGHGIEGPDGLKGARLEDFERDTRRALETSFELGREVIVFAMSTGASFAVPLVLEHQDKVKALVMLSPNFRHFRTDSELLRLPFGIGEWLATLVLGDYYQWKARNAEQEQYWTTKYPAEATVIAIRAAAAARNSDLGRLKIPVFTAYSKEDRVISVPAILRAVKKVGARKKVLLEVEGRENDHVIAGNILSPETTRLLEKKIAEFLVAVGLQRTQAGEGIQ